MKALILAGGQGSRMGEDTYSIPKPMVRIGSEPLIMHIMEIYARQGVTEFIVLAGHLREKISEFFVNYSQYATRIDVDLKTGRIVPFGFFPNYKVTVLDTGQHTMTGGRIRRAVTELGLTEDFYWTYGDGLGNVQLNELSKTHTEGDFLMTISGVQPRSRFGSLGLGDGNRVDAFLEKPIEDSQWVNAGFGIASPQILPFLEGDDSVLEAEPMGELASLGKLGVNLHRGFWHPMDTPKDKKELEDLAQKPSPPWLDGLPRN